MGRSLRKDRLKRYDIVVLLIAALAVFITFLHTIGLGDFWWHLASGRLIWQNGALHSEDPFSYTTYLGIDTRKGVFLNGYWALQLLYYLVYSAWGFTGMIVFHAAIMSLILLALYGLLRTWDVDPILSALTLLPGASLLLRFSVLRPQAISFLSGIIIILIAERGLQRLRERDSLKFYTPGPLSFFPLTMLVWANMHQGVLVGYAVIGVYVLAEGLSILLKRKGALSRAGFSNLAFWSAAGVAASFVNPNVAGPLLVIVNEIRRPDYGYILGFVSPIDYARATGDYVYVYIMAGLGLAAAVLMAAAWRRVRPAHVMLFVGFLYESEVFRLSIFFVLFSSALIGRHLWLLLEGPLRRSRPALAILTLGLWLFAASGHYQGAIAGLRANLDGSLPSGAVDFVIENGLSANLYNPFEYGGYLIWRLYPAYKVFIYSNIVDLDVLEQYRQSTLGTRVDLLDRYGVNTVLFYHIAHRTNTVQGVVLALIKNRSWRLVYYDDKASVFAREHSMSVMPPAMSKEKYLKLLLDFAMSETRRDPLNPLPLVKLADVYFAMGDFANAQKYYDRAEALGRR